MSLTLLPEEILEVIVSQLTIKDLVACSAVSLAWRQKFNADPFWKRFCLKNITHYLENVQSQVSPVFQIPEEIEERLEPLCKWRIRYMRQTHLINNWKSKNFLITDFRTHLGVVSATVKIDNEGTHWLFIRSHFELEIWNIDRYPHLHARVALFSDCRPTNVFLAGKHVLVSQWNILSIYDLKYKGLLIKASSRCILEEGECLPPTLWDTTNKNDIDSINEKDEFRYSLFGNLIVGYKRKLDFVSELHIWEINTGYKIKVESIQSGLYECNYATIANIYKINDEKGVACLYIKSELDQSSLNSQIFIYDFKKQKFTNINIASEGTIIWCGASQNVLVTYTSQSVTNATLGLLKFYSCLSGKLLSVKEIGDNSDSERMEIVDSYLIYCLFNIMNVLDIHKRQTLYCIDFSTLSYVRRVTMIERRFVVVWLLEHGESPGCPSYSQQVWDIKDLSKKVLQCSMTEEFEIGPSLIKQVTWPNHTMSVQTFW